jgi:AcrR family transcriptional regulator
MDAAEVASHQRARIHSAMLELVAERGYDAVTVRELARAAGVSTRSFYKHYLGKEQCFLRVHQLVVHRVLRACERLSESTSEEERRLSIEAIVYAWGSESKAARLLCVDAYAAGPAALKQAEWARRSIEMTMGRGFGDRPIGPDSSLTTEAIVAGLYSVTRHVLLDGKALPVSQLQDALTSWMLACFDGRNLAGLSPASATSLNEHGPDMLSPKGDVMAILNAAARLATTGSHESFSLAKLVEAAGVSRRTFNANFSSLEECLLVVLGLKAVDAMACVREASQAGSTAEESIYRVVAALCDRVTEDAAFAKLCFDASIAAGVPKMRYVQALIGDLARLVADHLQAVRPVDRFRVQASVGSAWGVIQNRVSMGRSHELPRTAPLLTDFLLTSAVGSPAVARTARREYVLTA